MSFSIVCGVYTWYCMVWYILFSILSIRLICGSGGDNPPGSVVVAAAASSPSVPEPVAAHVLHHPLAHQATA